MLPQQLEVGVTGGIGSGKSTVCLIFSALGIPVYEADVRSKWLLDNHLSIRAELQEVFGEKAYQNGKYNRAYLAEQVFRDRSNNQIINRIIHPRVAEDYENWRSYHAKAPYLLRESALLFEIGAEKKNDIIVVISAPVELRMERVLKRDTFRSREELVAIMDKQLPEEEKIKRADFVIYNDDRELVTPQVLQLHARFLSL
jgi:dephospho-CoA kinase